MATEPFENIFDDVVSGCRWREWLRLGLSFAGWMMTVLVLVDVRPVWSVAT